MEKQQDEGGNEASAAGGEAAVSASADSRPVRTSTRRMRRRDMNQSDDMVKPTVDDSFASGDVSAIGGGADNDADTTNANKAEPKDVERTDEPSKNAASSASVNTTTPGRPPRSKGKPVERQHTAGEEETPRGALYNVDNVIGSVPLKVHEPLRADPIVAFQTRQRRIDRLTLNAVPEIHIVGQIVSAQNVVTDASEGAFCRWKVDYGKAWEWLGGEVQGQTQVSYCKSSCSECFVFNHPMDLHFAEAGLQGWGGPRLTMQVYRMDFYGRRILAGYGFVHFPMTPGVHNVEVALWRPSGDPEQELGSFILGQTPALTSHEPLYESAWRDRCRMVTVSAGKIYLEVFVMTRNSKKQHIDA